MVKSKAQTVSCGVYTVPIMAPVLDQTALIKEKLKVELLSSWIWNVLPLSQGSRIHS